jgi:hypothetical protein
MRLYAEIYKMLTEELTQVQINYENIWPQGTKQNEISVKLRKGLINL